MLHYSFSYAMNIIIMIMYWFSEAKTADTPWVYWQGERKCFIYAKFYNFFFKRHLRAFTGSLIIQPSQEMNRLDFSSAFSSFKDSQEPNFKLCFIKLLCNANPLHNHCSHTQYIGVYLCVHGETLNLLSTVMSDRTSFLRFNKSLILIYASYD